MKYLPITKICDFQGGTQPPKSEWAKKPKDGYIRMLQIRDFTQPERTSPEFVKQSKRLKTCSSDDVLIGRYGASIGKILTGLSGAYNVAIIKALPDEKKLSKQFLYYLLKGPKFQSFISNVGARAAQAGFNQTDLSKFKVPILSLDDQKRIAYVLSSVEGLIAQRKKHLQHLDDFLISVFLEMFGDPVRNEKGWNKIKISDFSNVKIGPFGSLLHAEDYISGGIPLINPSHIVDGEIKADPNLTISDEKFHELSAYHLATNDVVVARRGEIGRCAIVRSYPKLLCGTGCMFIRISSDYSPFLLQYMISKTTMKNFLNSKAKGVTMKNLNSSILENIEVIRPPSELQKQFKIIIEEVEGIKSHYQAGLAELKNLYGALSQKAFKGELGLSRIPLPQDTGDVHDALKQFRVQEKKGLQQDKQHRLSQIDDKNEIAQKPNTVDKKASFRNISLEAFLRKRKNKVLTASTLWQELQQAAIESPPLDFQSFKRWVMDYLDSGRWLEQVYEEETKQEDNREKKKKIVLRIRDDS